MGLKEKLEALLNDASLDPGKREEQAARLLGYRPGPAERELKAGDEHIYAGLDERALSTPFKDYHAVFSDMKQGVLVDLGAGYCKGTLLSEALAGQAKCLSLELSAIRTRAAKSFLGALNLSAQNVRNFDLRNDPLPPGRAYFLYLPLGELVFRPLWQLLRAGKETDLYVAESHGDLLDFFLCLKRWFRLEKILPSEAVRHREGIYKFRFTPRKVETARINSPEIIYLLIQRWRHNPRVELEKENQIVSVSARSLLPIKYNGKMCLECLELKRIVDFRQVRVARL